MEKSTYRNVAVHTCLATTEKVIRSKPNTPFVIIRLVTTIFKKFLYNRYFLSTNTKGKNEIKFDNYWQNLQDLYTNQYRNFIW